MEYCAVNNLVIGGTIFPHRDIHKLTWNSPNRRDKNQIDHLMINSIWRRSLLDVKVRRGADVGSDHHLVVAQLKLKLKRAYRKTNIQKRFDTHQLKDDKVRSAFILSLRNRFQPLQDYQDEENGNNVDKTCEQIADVFTESSKENLGRIKRQKKKDWIQQETLNAMEERRNVKKRLLQTKSSRMRERQEVLYKEIHKKVKRLA